MQFLNEYLNRAENEDVRNYIRTTITNSVKHEDVTEIEHVIDYLNVYSTLERDTPLSERLAKIPYLTAVEKSKKWVEKLNQRAQKVVELDEDVELVKSFDGGFRLVKLKGKAAFDYEGKSMSHCVASYYNKKDCAIYSLRDAKNKPHCTIEVTGKIVSIKLKVEVTERFTLSILQWSSNH